MLVCGYCKEECSIDKYTEKEVIFITNDEIKNVLTNERYAQTCYTK